ncbi:nitroreductase family protein [Campylobacter fetus subsp. venerealis]|uniref:nitroreductase family protein n=1 Tax=Campylobacter fetus TaxID=196 RepID=UPI0018E85FF5|nr:nitroreductase family protein [Campylobacter fetus]QQF52148.1 nitroreductase family protein [Campylobacter fetus subsp. venerealis]
MDFNEVIDKRVTSREWTDREVDFAAIKRIIEAGMKAPSWDHWRNWQFIVLHTKEEKEKAFAYAKQVVNKFDINRYENRRLNLSQEMYAYAMPRQFTMLTECPYVIVPLFECKKLNGEWVSKLNPLTTAWCVAENIMLAAINEGLGYSLRIPLNREHDVVLEKLGVPNGWMTPCFIGIGYPKPDERVLKQCSTNPEGHIHMGSWYKQMNMFE